MMPKRFWRFSDYPDLNEKMKKKKPTYKELEARLLQAEEALNAIRSGEIDAIIGENYPLIVKAKAIEDALRHSEERFRLSVDGSNAGLWDIEFNPKDPYTIPDEIYISPQLKEFIGFKEDEFPDSISAWQNRILFDDLDVVKKSARDHFEGRKDIHEAEYRIYHKDGSIRWIHTRGKVLRDENGAPKRLIGIDWDITGQKRVEEEIKKLATVVDQSKDWVLITDDKGNIEYVNNSVEEISGYGRKELLGKNPRIFKSGMHSPDFYKKLWDTILAGESFSTIFINRKKTGELVKLHYTITPLKDTKGRIHHFVATAKDITEQKLLEEKLDFAAYHDILTGLPNRNMIIKEIDRLAEKGLKFAVVVADIDRFTALNDTYGYEAGDDILKEAGKRISETICRECTVARFEADKFAILLTNTENPENVVIVLEKIRKNFTGLFTVNNEEIPLTLSMGIAIFSENGNTAEILIKNAEVALSKAKDVRTNNYQFFSEDINIKTVEFMRLQRHLFYALEKKEFVMNYQPYFDCTTREMVGMEALIRWNSPKFGLVSPGQFIPILEETGIIIDVGKWIIQTVCRQIKEWMDKGYKTSIVPVYVNLSLAQFAQKDLSDFIEKTIGETGIYPSFLGFEITESIFMRDVQYTQSVLEKLKQKGIPVNIDDFGTGYSSLSNLKHLPVNNLKIDISFIRDVTNNPDDASIVITIISMAHNLNLKTIAEGVETEEQWKILRILKCDMVQGYYFSKPAPAGEIERLFRQQ